jgi:hypothetical protein
MPELYHRKSPKSTKENPSQHARINSFVYDIMYLKK